MFQKGLLKNNRLVTTVMSNFGFVNAMQSLGIDVVKSQVGDRYVIQEMLKSECNIGGEPSGHVIFLDHNATGDGLVCALQVLRIMIETGQKLSELASSFKRYPQLMINVKVTSKPPIESIPGLSETIREIETALQNSGRVLVRYSGTENILRVMVEGPKRNVIQQFATQIANVIKKEIGRE